MLKEYKTVGKEASASFVERGSTFIGYCCRAEDKNAALDFIKKIKAKHHDATHNVFAYVLRGNLQRYSDDGEPQGTAGVPVLDVLLKANVVDTVVVVTRYFGGTLLGAGGLVRAYSHACSLALDAGKIVTMAPCTVFEIACSYSQYDKLNVLLASCSAQVKSTDFTESVLITAAVKQTEFDNLSLAVTEATNGSCSCNVRLVEYSEVL